MTGGKGQHILVIKADTLAGFVADEPVFEAIRAAHPGARISLLTQPSLQRIARAAPYFDQVAATPDLRSPELRKAFFKQLRSAHFSRVYDLSSDDLSAKVRAGLGVMGPKWVIGAPPKKAPRKKDRSENRRVPATSVPGLAAEDRLPDLSWALAARKDSANMQPSWFGVTGHFGLLMPGADPARQWPAQRYAELARLMARSGVMPVLVGSSEVRATADQISFSAPEVVDLIGKTDHLQLAALAREADFFVTDVAEEMHLAVSVGCEGVLVRRATEAPPPPGRHLLTLTGATDLSDVSGEFAWRALRNMGLVAPEASFARAAAR